MEVLSRCVYSVKGLGFRAQSNGKVCRGDHRSMEPLDRPELRATDHESPTVPTVPHEYPTVPTVPHSTPRVPHSTPPYHTVLRAGPTGPACDGPRVLTGVFSVLTGVFSVLTGVLQYSQGTPSWTDRTCVRRTTSTARARGSARRLASAGSSGSDAAAQRNATQPIMIIGCILHSAGSSGSDAAAQRNATRRNL